MFLNTIKTSPSSTVPSKNKKPTKRGSASSEPRFHCAITSPTPPTNTTSHPYADEGLNPELENRIRPNAMIPADVIQPGETIILLIKPSLFYILLAPLRTLFIFALITLAFLVSNSYFYFTSQSQIMLFGIVAIGIRIFWQFVEWLSRTYILTDQRMIRIKGVTNISVYETPLSNIQQTEVIRSLREQLAGLGSIAFSTAGTGYIDAYWVMINRPYETQQLVIQAINRYGHNNRPPTT